MHAMLRVAESVVLQHRSTNGGGSNLFSVPLQLFLWFCLFGFACWFLLLTKGLFSQTWLDFLEDLSPSPSQFNGKKTTFTVAVGQKPTGYPKALWFLVYFEDHFWEMAIH